MKCAICGKEIDGFGNNPYPIRTDEDARCCDECNAKYVILGRLALMGKSREKADELAKMFNSWDFSELKKLG